MLSGLLSITMTSNSGVESAIIALAGEFIVIAGSMVSKIKDISTE